MGLIDQQVGRTLDRLLDSMRARARDPGFVPFAIALPDADPLQVGDSPRVTIRLASTAALRHLLNPSIDRLGEAYVEGEIDFEGSVDQIVALGEQLATSDNGGRRRGPLPAMFSIRHSRRSDRAAIQYHYDVSNEFYAAWLDAAMVYSCAYFRTGEETLDQAQFEKLDLICRKLRLAPGQRLLDVGCGWGGLVLHAARHYGVEAVGITLSQRQFELASARVREGGLSDRVQIRLQDYRDVKDGPFDRISSVGMFEHVGLKHLGAYFSALSRLLADDGLVMNHGITAADPDSRSVGLGVSEFIERYVFPDGELPHVALAIRELSQAGLELVDAESLRRHYALTCKHWSQRFETALPRLRDSVDLKVLRIWRLYLAGCALGFARGWINIYQLLAAKGDVARAGLPLTREDLYRPRQGTPEGTAPASD